MNQSIAKCLPRSLKDIPNREGFSFVGVTKFGEHIHCFVKKSFEGSYVVLSEVNNERVFSKLTGWY